MPQKNSPESNDLFHLLVESVKDYAIFTTDTKGKITSWNTGAERFFGYTEAEIIGQDFNVVFTPEDCEQGVPEYELRTAAAAGRAEDNRWHLRKDGTRFWASGMVTPLRDEAGNLRGFVKVGRDLTENKLAEDARLEIEERHRVIAETASDAIITIDETSTILFVNPAAGRIFGYSTEELKGASLTMLMPDYLRHVHNAGITRYVETGEKHIPWTGVELPALHKSGREIPVEISFGEFAAEGRRFFTGIIRDIGERKRAEKRLAAEHAVTRILAEEKTLAQSTPLILQTICDSLGWDLGSLWHVDNGGAALRCVETWHDPAVEVAEFTQMCHDTTFAPGEGLPGRVWQTGAPLWIDDVTQNPNFPRKQVAAKMGLRGAFAFPFVGANEVLGVMEFFNREIREPDRELLAMMSSVGSQIGQFIERRRAEEMVRRREYELADFIENATIGLHWVGGDGIIIWANKAELDLLGYTSEEYIGHHITEFHADQEVIDNILQRLTGDEALHDYEAPMRCKDGTIKQVLINSNVFRENGKFLHTRCFTRDVTERKQAEDALQKAHEELEERVGQRTHELAIANASLKEEIRERGQAERALRENHKLLHGVIEGTTDFIYVKDLDGRYLMVNSAGARFIGKPVEEVIGKTDLEVFPEEIARQLIEDDRRVLDDGETRTYEESGVIDGVQRWMLSAKSVYLDDDGSRIGLVGVSHDITERKRAEESVEAHREELSLILNNIEEIVYRGRLTADSLRPQLSLISSQTERLLGYRPEEFMANPDLWPGIVHTDDLPSITEQTRLLIQNGQPVTMEYRLKHKFTDEYCWIEDRIIPEINERGQVSGFFGAARDITRRRQRTEALKRSERELTAAQQVAQLGSWELDLATNEMAWSEELYRIYGLTHEEFHPSFEGFLERVHPEDRPLIKSIRQEAFRDHRPFSVDHRIVLPDGTVRMLHGRGEVIKDETGTPVKLRGIEQDITERKQAEDARREIERSYRGLVELSPDAVIVHSDGQIRYINPAGLKLVGASNADQIVSRPMLDFVHPDFHDIVKSHIDRTQQGKPAEFVEEKFVRLNGEIVDVEVGGIGIDYLGKPATQVIVREITERKRLEAERDTERHMLNALFEQLPVGVLVRDTEGRYSRTNQRVCDILGLGCDDLIGLTVDEAAGLINAKKPDGTPLTGQELPSAIATRTGSPSAPIEAVITTPTGEVRQITTTAAPVILGSGGLSGSVAVIVDVTEQHILQEQLRQSQKLESIGVLAGGVAHDFNNLLTAILGNTQLALRKVAPHDPVHERLIEVEKAGNRATSLTRQLLAFSRRQRLERKTLDLNDTVNDIMKMLKRIIGEDVEVRVQEVGYLSPVFADPAQIEQVVMNLAVNARDAMPGGGKLTIETRNVTLDEAYRRERPYAKTGKYVQMIVSDTGTGMDAETKGRIFEPFFTTKEAGKGTGLGLSMVFGIVKQHGGMIEVESEKGKGTTFHVYLPVDEKSVKEEAQDVLPAIRGGTETILVAEDEEALRGLARSVLEDLGYTVLMAKDGAEALEIYEANRARISLVLMDIVMPRMGGREAYERISQLDGAVPVLFMTGYSAEIVQYEFVKQNKFIEDAGAALMQKPYSVETLGRKVREVLDAARKR